MPADTFHATGSTVREAFGAAVIAWSDGSIYPWSPVFRATLRGADSAATDVVVKRSMRTRDQVDALARWQRHLLHAGVPAVTPEAIDGVDMTVEADSASWIAYAFVSGQPWDASIEQIAAAGRALGRQHAVSAIFDDPHLPRFVWREPSPASVTEDVAAITSAARAELGDGDAQAVADRWTDELTSFAATTLPAFRDADVPTFPVTLDYRITNLVFSTDGALPTMVDFENADVAPRLLDLAHSVLLMVLETTPNPGRLFNATEWVAFRAAYLAEAPPLTDLERALWPTALTYTRLEFGTWHLTEGAEWDWPGQRPFLRDLLTLNECVRFPLSDTPSDLG